MDEYLRVPHIRGDAFIRAFRSITGPRHAARGRIKDNLRPRANRRPERLGEGGAWTCARHCWAWR